jgi:hypothetical protein
MLAHTNELRAILMATDVLSLQGRSMAPRDIERALVLLSDIESCADQLCSQPDIVAAVYSEQGAWFRSFNDLSVQATVFITGVTTGILGFAHQEGSKELFFLAIGLWIILLGVTGVLGNLKLWQAYTLLSVEADLNLMRYSTWSRINQPAFGHRCYGTRRPPRRLDLLIEPVFLAVLLLSVALGVAVWRLWP